MKLNSRFVGKPEKFPASFASDSARTAQNIKKRGFRLCGGYAIWVDFVTQLWLL